MVIIYDTKLATLSKKIYNNLCELDKLPDEADKYALHLGRCIMLAVEPLFEPDHLFFTYHNLCVWIFR